MKLLRKGQAHLVASDCHDTGKCPPNLGQGMEQVKRKLGDHSAAALNRRADRLRVKFHKME